MRLIDADELRKQMYHKAFETDSYMQRWNDGCWIRYKMFENCIETLPTIDAVPVRHGEWYGEADGYADGELVYDMWYCSFCGKRFEEWDEKPNWNYCPNCGARMEGRDG